MGLPTSDRNAGIIALFRQLDSRLTSPEPKRPAHWLLPKSDARTPDEPNRSSTISGLTLYNRGIAYPPVPSLSYRPEINNPGAVQK